VQRKSPVVTVLALLLGGLLLVVAVFALSFAPLWPCPDCYDLDRALFGGCPICRGSNQKESRKRISFWKRRAGVLEIQSYGNQRIRLWVPSQR